MRTIDELSRVDCILLSTDRLHNSEALLDIREVNPGFNFSYKVKEDGLMSRPSTCRFTSMRQPMYIVHDNVMPQVSSQVYMRDRIIRKLFDHLETDEKRQNVISS